MSDELLRFDILLFEIIVTELENRGAKKRCQRRLVNSVASFGRQGNVKREEVASREELLSTDRTDTSGLRPGRVEVG